MKTKEQNGTVSAHSKTWPLYQREAFSVDVTGAIDVGDFESAEVLQRELHDLLSPYGLRVKVTPILVLEMLPEDQAEKNDLDRQALIRDGYGYIFEDKNPQSPASLK